jgi:predicted AAA+ superfamily ATPase
MAAGFHQNLSGTRHPQFGPRVPAETLRRFWTMLAHDQSSLLNAATLARGLGVDGKTVARYFDLLVDLLLVRRLPAWQRNVGKRLVRSPKVMVRDTGLVHALLGIPGKQQLLGHPVVGHSWESFVTETLLDLVPMGSEVRILPHIRRRRTHARQLPAALAAWRADGPVKGIA